MTPQLTRTLENDVMPKVLILLAGESEQSKFLSACAGDGAKAVRFTEVDIRAVAGCEPTDLRDYDGIIAVGSDGALSPALITLVDACESDERSDFANTVFGAAGFDNAAAAIERLARLGGIVVAERKSGLSVEAHAKLSGKRVAKLVEWVRHALSHEHSHHHHHAH
jgi:hypothetical protein